MSEEFPVTIYSSGTLVWSGDYSSEAVLEAGGNDSMFVYSGGTAAETDMEAGARLVAESGAVLSGINVNDDGAVLSGTDVYGSGAAKWYGPVACATGGTIVISGGTFTENYASTLNGSIGMGGVFQVWGGALTADGGTYVANSATGGGGAIYVCGGATIAGAEFTGNRAKYGGGVEAAHDGSYTISSAEFTGNSAEYGGGFENHQGASTLISDTVFTSNTAISGGAILNDNYKDNSDGIKVCRLTVNDTVFSGNNGEVGGAVMNMSLLTVSGGKFNANKAEEGKGGALYNVGTAAVSGAAFTENTAVYGGAVWQGTKNLTLENDTFTGNTAIYGGALYANGSGSTIISGGAFTSNSTPYDEDYELGGMGGAIYATAFATVTVTDAIFEGNFAEVNPESEWDGGCGGAVLNYGHFMITGGEFADNSAYYGGGLYNAQDFYITTHGEYDGVMTVTGTDFTNNTAEWGGGAICNCYGTLTVEGGTYSGNKVTGATGRDGGAIANWSDAEITEAIFRENTAVKGGALSHTGTTLTVTDAVFEGNTADQGGAFWQLADDYASPVATFANCTFSGNTATQGGAIWSNSTLTIENCTFDTPTDTIWNEGTITVNGTNAFSSIWTSGTITVNGASTFRSLELSLANSTTESEAVISGWSNLSGGEISIIAPLGMADGTYKVASGVDNWSGDIAFTVGTEDTGHFFTVENDAVDPAYSQIVCQDRIYTLAVEEGVIKLQVGGEIAPQAEAGSIVSDGTPINSGSDRAAKWNENTTVTSGAVIHIVGDGESTRNAWLGIEGTDLSGATIYGAAAGGTVDTVDLWLTSGAKLRNLAAGTEAGGTVSSAVNLMIDDATVEGKIYAGGLGTVGTSSGGVVVGEVRTLIAGGRFEKDVYGGALANYAKTEVQTDVGDVTLTVTGGTFDGNIYGASAVKIGEFETGGFAVHTAGKINVTVTGGEATKDAFCLFGGGYATGKSSDFAYMTDAVTIDISGGSWGTEQGGRGIFGGIFASKVSAEVFGDVSITISGGTMGNVYGGGWAQKGGVSTVGDVSIAISGGTVANVFGGGSHSTSGGATEAGDVTITVSGGNISGAIYARGQLDHDEVDSAKVIFTGNTDYSCGVYGYTYVGGAASDATLSFTDYTGTLSGAIGGFDPGITFGGNTAMTLTTASTNVKNDVWIFDLADRAAGLAGKSLLTWSGADFAGDSVKVNFTDAAQAKGGWNIAAVAEAFSGTTFDVEVGGTEIATGLAYNQQIASGDYQGWGFAVEDSVLKFKQLA